MDTESSLFDPRFIEQLAIAISSYIHPQIPSSIELWDKKYIAKYLLVSNSTIENYICLPSFPRSIPIGDGLKPCRRWKAAEVIKWAEMRQEKQR
jgi:predicted DNA-binding transcriptional regulator AlpA